MKKATVAVLNVLMFLTFSCGKKSVNSSTSNILESINARSLSDNRILSSRKFTYDASGKLTAQVYSSNANHQIMYNAQSQLSTIKYTETGNIEIELDSFVYNGNGKIIRKIATPLLANLSVHDHLFTYDAQGRLIADSQLVRIGTTIRVIAYNSYEYDSNENVTVQKTFVSPGLGALTLLITEGFSYDDKINPFSKINTTLYMTGNVDVNLLSKHNMIASKIIYSSNGTTQGMANPIVYNYYDNNLPKSVTYGTVSNSNSSKHEFIYK